MNEKLITELRGRAQILAIEKHYTGRPLDLGDIDKTPDFQIYMDRVHSSYEFLIELIVRECIERVREQYIPIRDQTIEGKPSPIHTHLTVRTERESGVIECGVRSVIALEELIQEQTDKWYKENIGVEE